MPRYDWQAGTIDGRPANLRPATILLRPSGERLSYVLWIDTDKREVAVARTEDGHPQRKSNGEWHERIIRGDVLVLWEEPPDDPLRKTADLS